MQDPSAALIYAMVLTSAADGSMSDAELQTMGEMVSRLPVFGDFDTDRLPEVAEECAALLQQEDGLARAFERIRAALPTRLRETAYALACEVVAADQATSQEELRLLEMLREALEVERLPAAAIERAARARYARP